MKSLLKKLFKPKFDPRKIDSLIAANVTIYGEIEYAGTIVVNGKIVGSLGPASDQDGPHAVIIRGHVTSDKINADFVVIEAGGTLIAEEITATSSLIIREGGTLKGKHIHYKEIELSKGATITGEMMKITAVIK